MDYTSLFIVIGYFSIILGLSYVEKVQQGKGKVVFIFSHLLVYLMISSIVGVTGYGVVFALQQWVM